MRISTITNWAYGVTVALTGLSGAAFMFAAHAAERERAAVEQNLAFDVVAEDLALGAEKLTDEARLYVMRGAARHLDAYRHEVEVVQGLDRALRRVRKLESAPAEIAAIDEAERNLGELMRLESQAVEAAVRGDRASGQQTLFGPEHERAQVAVVSALEHFRVLSSARTATEMKAARQESERAGLVARIMLGLTALLFLGVLYFVLRRRVSLPLTRMAGIVTRLARQDYAVEVPVDRRRDEIGDMAKAIQVFRENGLERDRLEAERRADQHAKDCILQMTHRLQACVTREELAEVVACFAPQTFPDLAGSLYILEPTRNALYRAASWLDPVSTGDSFAPTACWGVRRGRIHAYHGSDDEVACLHLADASSSTLCVPLTAQGDTIGLLYFEERPELTPVQGAPRVFLDLMADNVALALANQRLRERLASLAERDGLTGLLNRRRLDEAVRALKPETPMACVMIDIDHFKRFNDTFGHDAGDAVMQHVAQILSDGVHGLGEAYRFGGEEFTLLLPQADAATAFDLAERLRGQAAAATLAHHGRMLGPITISLGVAAAPDDGPATSLIRSADAALLHAKALGRDRTVLSSETPASARAGRRAS